jgi:MYXO-CTERM domain-containing protein
MAGTVQNHTNVNGTTVSSLEVGVNSTTEADTFADIPNDPAVGYTLTSQVVLENANVGVTGLAISASSGVVGSPAEADLVPEPVSAAVWGLGALGLVLAGAARRRRHHRRK